MLLLLVLLLVLLLPAVAVAAEAGCSCSVDDMARQGWVGVSTWWVVDGSTGGAQVAAGGLKTKGFIAAAALDASLLCCCPACPGWVGVVPVRGRV